MGNVIACKARAMTRESIRRVADRVRRCEGCERELYFDILHFMEVTLPLMIPAYVFRVAVREEMGDNHGLTFPDQGIVIIREDVYERAFAGYGRDRATVAHELFHLLMHKNTNITYVSAGGQVDIPSCEDPEWQADVFVDELLVPREQIKGMNMSEISVYCGVPLNTARHQVCAL